MKILLISPYAERNSDTTANIPREDFIPSAALLHLAAVLRVNNYQPILLDLNNNDVHSHKDKYLEYRKKNIIS